MLLCYLVFKVTLGLVWEVGVWDLVWEVMLVPKWCIPGVDLGSQRAFVGSEKVLSFLQILMTLIRACSEFSFRKIERYKEDKSFKPAVC